jgi:hypothetical protein
MTSKRPAAKESQPRSEKPQPAQATPHRSEDDPRVVFWKAAIKRSASWAMFARGTVVLVDAKLNLDDIANAAIRLIVDAEGNEDDGCQVTQGSDAWLVGPFSGEKIYVRVARTAVPNPGKALTAAQNSLANDRSELSVVYVSRAH